MILCEWLKDCANAASMSAVMSRKICRMSGPYVRGFCPRLMPLWRRFLVGLRLALWPKAIADSFGQMRFADLIAGRQIGDCARHSAHPMIAARRQLKPLGDGAQKLLCIRRKLKRCIQSLAAGISIGADHCMGFVALGLPRPRRIHARGHHG